MLYSRNSCISLWCTKTPLVIKNLKWADFVLSSDLNQKFSNYMQDLKILVTQKTAYKWNTTVYWKFCSIELVVVFKIFNLVLEFFVKIDLPCCLSWILFVSVSLSLELLIKSKTRKTANKKLILMERHKNKIWFISFRLLTKI